MSNTSLFYCQRKGGGTQVPHSSRALTCDRFLFWIILYFRTSRVGMRANKSRRDRSVRSSTPGSTYLRGAPHPSKQRRVPPDQMCLFSTRSKQLKCQAKPTQSRRAGVLSVECWASSQRIFFGGRSCVIFKPLSVVI